MSRPRWVAMLPEVPESWPEALNALDSCEAGKLVHEVVLAWIDGEIDPALDRRISAVMGLLGEHVPESIVRGEITDERVVRRWCWIVPWVVMGQDEDLLMMDRWCAPPLLEEASAGCPKRDFALAIVAHGIRDRAHHAVRTGAGLAEEVAADAALLPLARAARAFELVEYLERLQRYAMRGKVDEAEARSRVHDLHRCHPPVSVSVERRERRWYGAFERGGTLVVSADTGEMSIEPPIDRRGRPLKAW